MADIDYDGDDDQKFHTRQQELESIPSEWEPARRGLQQKN